MTISSITQTLGRRLARAKEDSGLSYRALAAETGLDVKTIQTIIHGSAGPRGATVASLSALADATGITLAELFRGT